MKCYSAYTGFARIFVVKIPYLSYYQAYENTIPLRNHLETFGHLETIHTSGFIKT